MTKTAPETAMPDRRTSPAMLLVAHEYAHLMIGIGVRVRPETIRTLVELEVKNA